MKTLYLLLSVVFSSVLFAETHIPAGNISGNWLQENSPYIVDGEVTIQAADLLTIEPSVEVIFSNHYKFIIYGRLLAEGTEADTISFSAENAETGWRGLRFIDTITNEQDSSKVVYCKFEDGNATVGGFYDRRGGVFACYNSSDVFINNCLFQNSKADYGGAIVISDSNVLMQNSVVKNNYALHDGGGIVLRNNSNAVLENLEILNNDCHYDGGGIFVCSGSAPLISNSLISGNACIDWESAQGGGISCWEGYPIINNVIISENYSQGGAGGLCLVQNSNPILTDVTIHRNSADWSGGGIGIYNSVINMAGVIVSENTTDGYGGGIIFGYNSGSVFDPDNRCNIYLNNSFGQENTGNDIRVYNNITIDIIVDTFTVLIPTEYYAEPLDSFTFDILNCKLNPAEQDLYVSPFGSDSNTGFSADDPLRTISYAVNKINPDILNPLTIHLAEGIYSYSSSGEFYPLEAKDFLSISGANQDTSILDGENLSRILQCYDIEDFSLNNLTIRNGYESDYNGGGAIYCYGTDIDISNVSFLNNRTPQKGGAIEFEDCSNSILTDVILMYNESIFGSGGGLYCQNSNITLSGVKVKENSSFSAGGGLYFNQSDPVFDPENLCTIYMNSTLSSAQDLGSYYCDIDVIVDTFTVLEPDEYYADSAEDFTFDIQNAFIDPVEANLYINPIGDDENSGLNSGEPLKTITQAYQLIASNNETTYTVFLANGTYSPSQTGETFPLICRKNVILAGENREQTILDAEETGRIFNCVFPNITIQGLTVKNGLPTEENWYNTNGGGIYIYWAENCNLVNLEIIDNHTSGQGGGIYSSGCNPTFESLIIENNTSGYYGGGICLDYSNPIFRNLDIIGNYANYGGGVYFENSEPVFDTEDRCDIYLNNSQSAQGKDLYSSNYQNIVEVVVDTFTVIYPDNFFAYPIEDFSFDILNSAVIQYDSDMYVSPAGSDDNTGLTPEDPLRTITFALQQIVSNSENPHTLYLAEGIYSNSATGETFPLYGKNHINICGENPGGTVLDAENNNKVFYLSHIEDFKLENLTIANGNNPSGGGIDCYYTNLKCNDVLFRNNTSNYGGGINSTHSYLYLNNVTMVNNFAQYSGSGVYGDSGSYIVSVNSIFRNENGNEIYFPPYNGTNDCIIVYSDILGGEESVDHSTNTSLIYQDNIDDDPLFEDEASNNFHLLPDSPCIDAGIAFFQWNNEIIIDLPEDQYFGIAPDMGAFEYGMSSLGNEDINAPAKFSLLQNYPNPFNPITTISFSVSHEDTKDAKIEIYNIKGQKIKIFCHPELVEGSVIWNGTDNNNKLVSSGIYFYKLTSGKKNATKKMLLLK